MWESGFALLSISMTGKIKTRLLILFCYDTDFRKRFAWFRSCRGLATACIYTRFLCPLPGNDLGNNWLVAAWSRPAALNKVNYGLSQAWGLKPWDTLWWFCCRSAQKGQTLKIFVFRCPICSFLPQSATQINQGIKQMSLMKASEERRVLKCFN